MTHTQRFNEIFSPISPVQLPDLTLYDPSHHPISQDDAGLRIPDENNTPTHTIWSKRAGSPSRIELHTGASPSRGFDDQVTLGAGETKRVIAPTTARSPPPRLDDSPAWELALPSQDATRLRPPSTSLSRTTSRLEKPFSPYIPETMHTPTTQGDPIAQEVSQTQTSLSSSPWPNIGLFILRLVTLAACGAVFALLAYSVSMYNSRKNSPIAGNGSLTWPSNSYLVPDAVIFAVTFADFISSVLIIGMSLIRGAPSQSMWKDYFKICISTFFAVAWVGGLVVFKALDKKGSGSLRYVACSGKNLDRDFSTVCTFQTAAFYVGVGVGSSELFAVIGLILKIYVVKRHRRELHEIEMSIMNESWR